MLVLRLAETWTSSTKACSGSTLRQKMPVRQLAGLGLEVLLDATITEENACTTAGGTWDGTTACTVDDNRDIKVWFTVDPSVSAATTEVICARAGGAWDRSTTTCTVTEENACNTTGGVFTCTITAEKTCTAAGGTWVSGTSTCTGATQNACTTAGGNWESGTSTCTFVVENTCTAAGGTWEGCTGTTDSACTTAGGTWAEWYFYLYYYSSKCL